ncbi:MAG: TRAM domain-containing protein [Gemmatimonadota bacterium]|nr:TRAM domain-containing protein [Gemmatimonadota bacterium]
MNTLRVILGLLVVWVGALAVVYEPDWVTYAVVGGGAAVILVAVLFEGRIRQGDPRQVMSAAVGLVLGLGVAWLVYGLILGLPVAGAFLTGGTWLAAFGTVLLFAVLGYLGATTGRSLTYDLTLFRQPEPDAGAKARFLVGEKSLIDGRIVKLAESPLLSGEIVVPRFVVDQLNQLAASHVPVERFRGERGLDALHRLQQNRLRAVYIREIDLLHGEIEGVLDYAVQHDARIVTHNPEMIKEAGRRGIPVVNLNEIAGMLEPEVLSGDEIVVRLVKPGKEKDQGVGYLDNGNMVVVEDARDDIGKTVRVRVTGLHQTRAGTLVFAEKVEAEEEAEAVEGAART